MAFRGSLHYCRYTDSPDGNWVIGPFPGDPTLFLATSGSGHGFKVSVTIRHVRAAPAESRRHRWNASEACSCLAESAVRSPLLTCTSISFLLTPSFYQFLPNIGRLVVDSLEGTLDATIAARFAVDRDVVGAKNDERASNVPCELDIGKLCGPEDL